MKTINVKNPRSKEYSGPGGYSVKNITFNSPKAGCDIGFYDAEISKGKSVDAHRHKTQDELFYFLDPCRVRINDTWYDVEKDTAVYINAGDEHELEAPNNNVRYMVIRLPFDPDDKYTPEGKQVIQGKVQE